MLPRPAWPQVDEATQRPKNAEEPEEHSTARASFTELSFGVGTQRVIPLGGATAFAVEDPTVVQVHSLGSGQLLLVGAQQGATWLWLFTPRGLLKRVALLVNWGQCHELAEELQRRVRALAPSSITLRVRWFGETVAIRGELASVEEANALRSALPALQRVQSLPLLDQTTVAPSALAHKLAEIRAELTRRGLARVRLLKVNESLLLDGDLSDEHRKQAQSIVDRMWLRPGPTPAPLR